MSPATVGIATGLISLIVASAGCRPYSAPPTIRNVILVSIDSLRPDRLGIYGHAAPTSPTIDRLGEHGVVFDNAYASTSWTLPSHVSLFSGLDDHAHGVIHDGIAIPSSLELLAEVASRAGIRTTGFFSGPYLRPEFGFARGFDEYIDCTSYGPSDRTAKVSPQASPSIMRFHPASHQDVTNPALIAAVKKWLNRSTQPGRNFVFLHMWDIHTDYIAPRRYVEMFDPDYGEWPYGPVSSRTAGLDSKLPGRDRRHLFAMYDAEIRYTDDTLGEILQMMESAGLLENSAVIVLADHGEELLERTRVGHRWTLYEEVLRIPMLITLPGRPPVRKRVQEVVSLVDIKATVCDLFELDCSPAGPGRSLLDWYLPGRDAVPRRGALAELSSSGTPHMYTSFVLGSRKIIKRQPGNTARFFVLEPGQLDREATRFDVRSIADADIQEVYSRMEARIAAAREQRAVIEDSNTSDAPVLDTTTEQHLRELGYIE